jgi:hypothetical protein
MGTVITFPNLWRDAPVSAPRSGQGEPATVIILPVIRIERHGAGDIEPSSNPPGKRRRGRDT